MEGRWEANPSQVQGAATAVETRHSEASGPGGSRTGGELIGRTRGQRGRGWARGQSPRSFIRPCSLFAAHSLFQLFVLLCPSGIHPFIHLFMHSLIPSFLHSLTHLFVSSPFIHSVMCSSVDHEKEMAPHPIILAWRIPWAVRSLVGSMGSQRVRHD